MTIGSALKRIYFHIGYYVIVQITVAETVFFIYNNRQKEGVLIVQYVVRRALQFDSYRTVQTATWTISIGGEKSAAHIRHLHVKNHI